jgi:hypothetical protein
LTSDEACIPFAVVEKSPGSSQFNQILQEKVGCWRLRIEAAALKSEIEGSGLFYFAERGRHSDQYMAWTERLRILMSIRGDFNQ